MADWIENDKNIFNDIKNKGPFMSDDGASDGDNTHGSSIFSNENNPLNDNPFGGGDNNMGMGGGGGGYNNYGNNGNTSNENEDLLDVFINLFIKACKAIARILAGAFISVKACIEVLGIRTADELNKMAKTMLIVFGPAAGLSLILYIIGFLLANSFEYIGLMTFMGYAICSIFSGAIFGLLKLYIKNTYTKDIKEAITKVEQSEEYKETQEIAQDYEESFDDIMNSILGEEEKTDDSNDIEEFDSEFNFENDQEEIEEEIENKPIEMPVITPGLTMNKEQLWNTFAPMFRPFNKKFDKYDIWTSDNEFSNKFEDLETILRRIIADIYNMTIEELDESGFEIKLFNVKNALMYCYIELQKPNKKQIKPEILQQYLDNYSSALLELLCDPKQLYTGEDAEVCNKVSSAVKIDGDRFKITITKPNKDPILLGDVFIKEGTKERMINEKTQPIVLGINSIGHPIVYGIADKARPMFSGTIGGPPSSGKSWFIQAWLIQLLAFFLPEEVQVIVVDPKGDPVFNAFIPHPNFCRLIQGDTPKTGESTFNLIKTLIDEGARRQQMFGTQNVSDIQGWRKKGNKLPTIYCFIDELPTLIGDIEEWGKEANEKAIEDWQDECDNLEKGQTKPPKPKDVDYRKEWGKLLARAVTKLRASGIYIYVISQRLTGYVDKTFRDLTPFRIVLRGMELLPQVFPADGLKNFTQKLVNAGDSAVQLGDGQDVQYVKTLGVCLNEDDLYPLVENISKVFYKMGVEIPDMSVLGLEFVKDLNKIKDELYKNSGNIAQFDENSAVSIKPIEKDNIDMDEDSIDNKSESSLDDIIDIKTDGTIITKEKSNKPLLIDTNDDKNDFESDNDDDFEFDFDNSEEE